MSTITIRGDLHMGNKVKLDNLIDKVNVELKKLGSSVSSMKNYKYDGFNVMNLIIIKYF